ncbi:transposase [Couchioplanes caeruleus]|uniref:Transposase n=2 Tax=Couchioplanes caeruleus TaxID=56438 RepID=A0A1K0FBQ5_9ACTN|nr:transposase [Couchioplanes caeruleus]OJF10176.1 hypothetical protein BG844_33485 [Couchioplanes caeruleus subsp. caeruleus]ROP34463.1 transposase [Couchioplanes caeruleus]
MVDYGVRFNFISCDRERVLSLPPDVRQWLPPQHLCGKVLAAVQKLDLSAFLAGYRADGQGHAAYPPDVVLSLVLYCYSKGIRSSRRIEAACLDDVGCRIIAANQQIDHATIARFLRRHRHRLESLFLQVLALCGRRGMVDLSAVAVDGSPMHANAARSSNRTLQQLEAVVADGEARIARSMTGLAPDTTTASAQPAGLRRVGRNELSWGPLARLGDRIARARTARDNLYERALPSSGEIQLKVEAAERMVARAEQRLAAVTAAHTTTLQAYARRTRQDQAVGRQRANGRPPVALHAKASVLRQRERLARAQAGLQNIRNPHPTPSPRTRASLTDPQSRLMLGKRGGYVQGYNVQIASTRNQLLLTIELQDNPSDMTALVPVVKRTQHNCAAAGIDGQVAAWLADSGYASAANFAALNDLPLFVSVTQEYRQTHSPHPPQPASVPAGQRDMAARLATPAGRELYARRSALVEPGFAQLFQRFGRHLHYRGATSVDAEIKLLGAVHNLNKLFRHDAKRPS